MADEALADVPIVSASGMRTREPSQHKSQRYGDAEFLNQQPRLIDLIPNRPWVLASWFFGGLTIVGLLELACGYLCLAGGGSLGIAQIFDMGRKDCLASWFAQLMLVAAAVVACLVYSIRRHRTDDYQGRYRVWIWAALAWFYLAADKVAGIHEAIQQTLVQLSGTTLVGDGALWWIIPYALLGGAIAFRLLWDLRESWPTLTMLSLAAAVYGVALGWRLSAAPDEPLVRQAMFQQGAELVGHWLSLLAVCTYLRHVIRDAQGLLPRREPKPASATMDKSAEVGENVAAATAATTGASAPNGTWRGIDPPHPTPAAPVQSRPAPVAERPAASPPASTATVHEDSHPDRKMTKADKKALKERLMRERMERERQQSAKWRK